MDSEEALFILIEGIQQLPKEREIPGTEAIALLKSEFPNCKRLTDKPVLGWGSLSEIHKTRNIGILNSIDPGGAIPTANENETDINSAINTNRLILLKVMTVAFRPSNAARKIRSRPTSAGASNPKITSIATRQRKAKENPAIAPRTAAQVTPLRSAQSSSRVRSGLTPNPKTTESRKNKATRTQTPSNPWAIPFWLRSLVKAQTVSSFATFLLVGAALFIYGSTVYYQQQWGTSFRELESLRRQERKLISTNESLKTQFSKQAAEPSSGLVPPNLNQMIFLKPTPVDPPESAEITGKEPPTSDNRPVGY